MQPCRALGFILCMMRACRHEDYSKNQIKPHLFVLSGARVRVPGTRGGGSGAIATLVAANPPWPESPAKLSHVAACDG